MRNAVAVVLGVLLAGCAYSYKPCHRSPLIELSSTSAGWSGEARGLRRHAAWFEEAIVRMADDFDVPLEDVIPVRVYHDGRAGRSYYNRLTRSIVLRGEATRGVFVHELSHLLAHRIDRSPAYWSDQALAEYMEARFAPAAPAGDAESAEDRERRLVRRIAQARDPADVLTHLRRDAVDEDRGWGLMVVRYLFDERWASEPLPSKIRRLFGLSDAEVADIAPEVLRFCRRWELVARASPPAR